VACGFLIALLTRVISLLLVFDVNALITFLRVHLLGLGASPSTVYSFSAKV